MKIDAESFELGYPPEDGNYLILIPVDPEKHFPLRATRIVDGQIEILGKFRDPKDEDYLSEINGERIAKNWKSLLFSTLGVPYPERQYDQFKYLKIDI